MTDLALALVLSGFFALAVIASRAPERCRGKCTLCFLAELRRMR